LASSSRDLFPHSCRTPQRLSAVMRIGWDDSGRSLWSPVSRWRSLLASATELRRSPGPTSLAGPSGLPAPVVFESARAVHTLLPNGRIVVGRARRERCGGITWMLVAGEGACLVQRGGRIAVVEKGRDVWRSTGRYRVNGVFAKLGPRAIAFSYESFSWQGRLRRFCSRRSTGVSAWSRATSGGRRSSCSTAV
jgi:hypothetical protein